MNLPRLALLACLMVFLFFPALWLGMEMTNRSLEDPCGFYAGMAWLGSAAALLLLSAVYVRREPDLVRGCLWAMGVVGVVFVLFALSLPAIVGGF